MHLIKMTALIVPKAVVISIKLCEMGESKKGVFDQVSSK